MSAPASPPSVRTVAAVPPCREATPPRAAPLPLGALAAGFGLVLAPAHVAAQTPAQPVAAPVAASAPGRALPKISVRARAETDRDSLNATTSTIGKGRQALRDIPQSVTVVTEKLIADRRLDTLKEVLHQTAGVTFLAAEGGEEDIRLRGFSLAATGDIYLDGLRDPAFYDRDTFNYERVELLRGSASMLFGRGSTGGVVNQVHRQPQLVDESVVQATVGSGGYVRGTGDFSMRTGETAALRIGAMATHASNHGNRISKQGIAPSVRWGIGTADEFTLGLYYLRNDNGLHYGMPWLQKSAGSAERGLVPVDPRNYYAPASDYSAGSAGHLTLTHLHRFGDGAGELKTTLREGRYRRDQRASAIRFYVNADPARGPLVAAPTLDTLSGSTLLNRGNNFKVQDLQTTYLQSDYANRFAALGLRHELLAGVDAAHERFQNYAPAANSPVLDKNTPRPSLGTPDDGTSVDESRRIFTLAREFDAKSLGVYAQDLVQVAPAWKLLGGLRWDLLRGRYRAPATATTADTVRSRSDSLWSRRFGVLYQPTAQTSLHFSYGTSFNTSGDTYQYDNQTENTPPERSENLEFGARLDSRNGRLTTRLAVFRSTKLNERNRDPDSAATQNLLSGRRHAAGFELDLAGRLTPAWEVYGSYAWIPVATIDVGAPGSTPGTGEGTGTRSSLTPRHSGTIWSTWRLTREFRFGGGLNARSSQTPNRNPAGVVAPAFVTADLVAEYRREDWSLRLNVNNVTNKLYADGLYSGHYIPGLPRSVQLSLGSRF